ncbi:adenylyl-sulfate kinase [Thermodesulfovibrio yellowstonii]|uniref:Adenylyl-sulfate kinase n=1 Tax=Thermodesulfovibrio yellowstonii (strain ATCC 51303 / DSM 11347 / YP87) TaxID=289376 RepID=CYSC_THEYD|nr:adenylyl-sulfate kinase [Thermodesulfovibrio yellowstonii]B5YJA6.1 RecName: Full=Adenylyl-sulfate kinase; AltName: Full=APS kinase; AltName: Full=ATP adenosine-5'-phosphosulfate 3'-phosphotransferase; AltName: Full=Adenosine-5'-phosphosulfate kinase [Thermodesulfovibrio yellowstonii DSM 11347]ACI21415.1 adenylylsulfate kinase [Thermodesulfovibrio yellowstonii DSM 11347]
MKKSNNNLTLYKGYINREDRERLHGHKSFVIWFTGLPASGKSTIAHLVEKELYKRGCSTYVLDGDNVRYGLCSDLGFSIEERKENIRRVGELVKLFVDAGIIVITSFISPFKEDREKVRSLFKEEDFIEVYTKCPVETCSLRDQKGIYKKAIKGEIKNFTGISAPYEEPENPEITIFTDIDSPIEACQKILRYIKDKLKL